MGDETLELLWKNALDHWDDDKPHVAFMTYCQNADQLAEAAARYKGMTGDRERGEAAKKWLQGIAMLAIARLESTRTHAPRARRWAGSLLLAAMFLAAALALALHLAAQ